MLAGLGRMVAAAAMVCVSYAAVAQAPAGREREQFQTPPAPRAVPGGPAVTLPGTVAPPGADKIKLVVRDVHIVGSTVYSRDQLTPLYGDLIGRSVSLAAVYDLAQRITAKYGADGYVLSRAIVPPQQLSPGGAVVRIEIVEGYVDAVEWPPQVARYRDFFSDYTAKIIADRPSNVRTIERYLLLASDLPGLKFRSTLRASKHNPAASTLIVEVIEKPVDLLGRIDNRGTPQRGPFEYLTQATINNLLGQHEGLTLTYAGVAPLKELYFLGAAYRQVLTSEGLTFFANASYAWGKPGTQALESIDYATRSAVVESGLSYPFIRSRERNLTLSVYGFGSNNDTDALEAPLFRDHLRGFRVKTEGDAADWFNGINQLILTYSHGIEGLGSSQNGDPLLSRANGRVDFDKFEAYFTHLQPLFWNFSTLLMVYGQYSAVPLLVPEECGYGGRVFGRAFDPSQFLGDRCIEGLAELRYDLPPKGIFSQAQFYGYVDYGNLYTIGLPAFNPGQPPQPAGVQAASAGAGVRLGFWQNQITTDVSVAKAIEGDPNQWRVFVTLTAHN